MKNGTENKIISEGKQGFLSGMTLADNPKKNPEERRLWIDGWKLARTEADYVVNTVTQ